MNQTEVNDQFRAGCALKKMPTCSLTQNQPIKYLPACAPHKNFIFVVRKCTSAQLGLDCMWWQNLGKASLYHLYRLFVIFSSLYKFLIIASFISAIISDFVSATTISFYHMKTPGRYKCTDTTVLQYSRYSNSHPKFNHSASPPLCTVNSVQCTGYTYTVMIY